MHIVIDAINLAGAVASVLSYPLIAIPLIAFLVIYKRGDEMRRGRNFWLYGLLVVGLAAYAVDIADRFGWLHISNQHQGEYDYGLRLTRIDIGEDKKVGNIQPIFNLQNFLDVPVKYEVEFVSVTIDGKDTKSQTYASRGGIVPRRSSATFLYPTIDMTIGNNKLTGPATISYKYGPASGEFLRTAKYNVDLTVFRNNSGNLEALYVESESSEANVRAVQFSMSAEEI
jgi:hypothetical protein